MGQHWPSTGVQKASPKKLKKVQQGVEGVASPSWQRAQKGNGGAQPGHVGARRSLVSCLFFSCPYILQQGMSPRGWGSLERLGGRAGGSQGIRLVQMCPPLCVLSLMAGRCGGDPCAGPFSLGGKHFVLASGNTPPQLAEPFLRNEKSAQRGSFGPGIPADIRPKTSVRHSNSWKNKHLGTDMPRGCPRKKLRSDKLRADISLVNSVFCCFSWEKSTKCSQIPV